MSSDRNPADQFAMTILIVVVLASVCAWLSGCAPHRLEPETPAPTAEEMQALLNRPIVSAKPVRVLTTVELSIYPMVVLEGEAVRVKCLVPDAPERGSVRIALEGVRSSTDPLPGAIEHSLLVERVPCVAVAATCIVRRAGARDVLRTQPLTVRGGLCDGGGQ